MSQVALLRPADLRLIQAVAAHRRGQPRPDFDEAALTAMLEALSAADVGATLQPFRRAAGLARGLLDLTEGGQGRQVALLALCCQLRLEGYQLTAPQGVLAGMIDGMSRGRTDVDELSRWLEDRALLLGGG